MSLVAFGSTTLLTSLQEEREDHKSKKVRVDISSAPSVPTLLDVQERLMSKVQILKTELPKAQEALCTIEEVLAAKARSIRSADLRRATELAGPVSTMSSFDLCSVWFIIRASVARSHGSCTF